jgi:RimJ/RimL family protein N-acetyltransferase
MMKKLNDGKEYYIRDAEGNDAKGMIKYVNSIASESDNLTFGPGEFEVTIEEEIKILNSAFKSEIQLFIIAELNSLIIGNLSFRAGKRPRVEHTGEFGVSVLKEFWGNGVGKELINNLLDWAKKSNKITKINLRVREDNERAIELYKKMGFEVEGLVRRDMQINGVYTNSYQMGMLIN